MMTKHHDLRSLHLLEHVLARRPLTHRRQSHPIDACRLMLARFSAIQEKHTLILVIPACIHPLFGRSNINFHQITFIDNGKQKSGWTFGPTASEYSLESIGISNYSMLAASHKSPASLVPMAPQAP